MTQPKHERGPTETSSSSAPIYEMVPSRDLPQLDLSRSVGGELIAFCQRLLPSRNRVADETLQPHWFARSCQQSGIVQTRGPAGWFLLAYAIGNALGAIACLVPREIGIYASIIGLLLVVPGSLASLACLRFDMLKLLFETYDFWFYSFVNTAGAVLVAYSFNDARACIAGILWLGNIHTVLIDANTRLVCFLVLGSSVTIALNLVVLVAMETASIDGWQTLAFRLRQQHSGLVVCNNLISNCFVTIMIVLARNMYRRHMELAEQFRIGCPLLRCLNFRCRVRFHEINHERLAAIDAFTPIECVYYKPTCAVAFPVSQMHFLRMPNTIDASQTVHPVQLEPLQWRLTRMGYVTLGAAGLAATTLAFVVFPSWTTQPLAIIGLICTMLFVGLSVGLVHPRIARGIVLSFDYLFLSMQLSFGLLCASMLFHWDARSVALAAMWLWLHFVLSVDTLTPQMRHKIGVNIKLLVLTVLLLFLAAQMAVAAELIWLNRWGLEDRVLLALAQGRISLRLLPFFVSRLVMSCLWSLRLLWRVLTSRPDDALVQLGRVAFAFMDHAKMPPPSGKVAAAATGKAASKANRKRNPTAAAVVPLEKL